MRKIDEKSLKKVRKIMMITTILSFGLNTIMPVYAADDICRRLLHTAVRLHCGSPSFYS